MQHNLVVAPAHTGQKFSAKCKGRQTKCETQKTGQTQLQRGRLAFGVNFYRPVLPARWNQTRDMQYSSIALGTCIHHTSDYTHPANKKFCKNGIQFFQISNIEFWIRIVLAWAEFHIFKHITIYQNFLTIYVSYYKTTPRWPNGPLYTPISTKPLTVYQYNVVATKNSATFADRWKQQSTTHPAPAWSGYHTRCNSISLRDDILCKITLCRAEKRLFTFVDWEALRIASNIQRPTVQARTIVQRAAVQVWSKTMPDPSK